MENIKSIVFLGFSGFPYGLAEVQKIANEAIMSTPIKGRPPETQKFYDAVGSGKFDLLEDIRSSTLTA